MTEILCRPITLEDSADVLDWRNDLVSRQMSFNYNKISSTEHSNWFSEILAISSHIGFIGEINCEKIGVVFFKVDNAIARVSINLNPQQRGKKLAANLLRNGMKEAQKLFPQIDEFSAKIKNTNSASVKVFAQNGFVLNAKQDGFSVYNVKSSTLGVKFDV